MSDRAIRVLGGVFLGILVILIATMAHPEMTAHLFAPIEVRLLRHRARFAAKPMDRMVSVYLLLHPQHGEFWPDYATALIVLQTDSDPEVRRSVAEDLSVSRIKPDSAMRRKLMRDVLATVLQRAESDPDPAVRCTCLGAASDSIIGLVALGRSPVLVRELLDPVMNGLVKALSDPEEDVRAAALRNLSRLHHEGLVPEPPETADAKVWQKWLQTWREERSPP